jgi:hypothetical protein
MTGKLIELGQINVAGQIIQALHYRLWLVHFRCELSRIQILSGREIVIWILESQGPKKNLAVWPKQLLSGEPASCLRILESENTVTKTTPCIVANSM